MVMAVMGCVCSFQAHDFCHPPARWHPNLWNHLEGQAKLERQESSKESHRISCLDIWWYYVYIMFLISLDIVCLYVMESCIYLNVLSFCSWFEGCPILGAPWKVELVVPHTPCLSCVGAFTQLRRWAPRLQVAVVYQDWCWEKKGRSRVTRIVFLDTLWLPCKCRVETILLVVHMSFAPKFVMPWRTGVTGGSCYEKASHKDDGMPRRHTVSILGMNI